ncbi:hypothetical protein [Lacticaseibacillus daqingensis]|uniref:hypothetical protein n=1 Tax=Lacticaseibacillus daqingensis TaxID=2486014 RepID=UPI0013DE19A1|nr:hypothetical protein [Lacticaseibacillus daqingensis]
MTKNEAADQVEVLEVAGEVVGQVIQKDTKTLLIRRGFIIWQEECQELVLTSEAVFVSRELVESCYWVKLKPTTLITEAVDIDDGRQLICKLLDVHGRIARSDK